jgi:hypothetical protein
VIHQCAILVLEYLNKEPNLVALTVAATSSAQDVQQMNLRQEKWNDQRDPHDTSVKHKKKMILLES